MIITDRQRLVLRTMQRYRLAHGRPPVIREIARALGISPNGVHCHLLALRAKCLVRWERHRSRTLTLTRGALRLIRGGAVTG